MEKQIKTPDGLLLWSEAFGRKTDPAVLLVMGAMNQGTFWPDAFCEALAEAGFYVIRYDHRDTGQSQAVDFSVNPYDLNALAQDALAVLQGHAVQQAHVVGLSMGGYIAQLMAIQNPEHVGKLVLISTSADQRPYMQATMGQADGTFLLPAPEQTFLDYIAQSISKPPTTPEEATENLIEGWRVTYGGPRPFPKESIAQALRRSAARASEGVTPLNHALATAASPDRLEAVGRIQVPVLVMHGRHDPCLPLAHGQYLADHIPNAQLQVLDMGHSFQWSWDDEVQAAIIRFLVNPPLHS